MSWYRISKLIVPGCDIIYCKNEMDIDDFYKEADKLGYNLFVFAGKIYEITKEHTLGGRIGYREAKDIIRG